MKIRTLAIKHADLISYGLIFMLTLLRVLTTKVIACPADFDCNSYIQMANHLGYDPDILPHHAMRIFPSYAAHLLTLLGFSLPMAFRVLSDSTYILFGCLAFWSLRQNGVKYLIALSFTMLCLAPHHAMRIPLQNVYQLCDILTYPLALLLLHFSLKCQQRVVFLLAIVALFTKQTLFGLGGLSLLYCFYKTKRIEIIVYIGVLAGTYLLLQDYYHAFSIVSHHLIPESTFFSASHLGWILNDSRLIELFIPLLPFLVVYAKQTFMFLLRSWHVGFYMGVIICQPLIAYHLTGNNFQRLALQGIWLVYFIVGLVSVSRQWPKKFEYGVLIYCSAIYFTWGMSQRIVLTELFTLFSLAYYFVRQFSSYRSIQLKSS
ncbi:MAG: hypothetical protein JSS07_06720 [Proteobacteria bacterium]|nr:hypothetical protein [Pseudomonadota bacterium]